MSSPASKGSGKSPVSVSQYNLALKDYCFFVEQLKWPSTRCVGLMMETIEILGLPPKQEEAVKNQIKKAFYATMDEELYKTLQAFSPEYKEYMDGKRGWYDFEYSLERNENGYNKFEAIERHSSLGKLSL